MAALVVVLFGCPRSSEPDASGADRDGVAWEETDEATTPDIAGMDPADARDAQVPGEDALLEVDARPDVPDPDVCPEGHVFIDFPCGRPFECLDPHTYRPMRTTSCQDEGYDPRCCSGGGCWTLPEETCAEGRICVPAAGEPCAEPQCGMEGSPGCADTEYCETVPGYCEGGGVCLPREGYCPFEYAFEPPGSWVCGCDGRTYPDDCWRFWRGPVAKASEGLCCTPALVGFTQANPDGFDGYVACCDVELGVCGDALRDQDPSIRCESFPEGYAPCGGGTSACFGDLERVAGGTALTDDAWLRACRVASTYGITAFHGTGGTPCDGIPCEPTTECGRCFAPCGCCACPEGGSRCSPTIGRPQPCKGGCWAEPVPCELGAVCQESDGKAACVVTCAALLEAKDQVLSPGGCDQDFQCEVLRGRCDVGLGGCWEAAYNGVPQADLDALATRWAAARCGGVVCKCGAAPSGIRCVDHVCTLVP